MKRLLIIACLGIMLGACSDFLKEYSQDKAYVRGYEDLDELLLGSVYMPAGAILHLGDVYSYDSKMEWYYPYIHLMADEVDENTKTSDRSTVWDARQRYFGYYTWQQQVGIDQLGTTIRNESGDWDRIYKHINVANMVLADIDNQSAETEEDRLAVSRIKGEAYFLRAAYYFTLANLYGKPYVPATAKTDLAVPIKLTEFIEDKVYSRNTVEEVYAQVLADLTEAEKCLSATERKSIYRADITAVCHLRSRVHLYMQNWEEAVRYAQKTLDKQSALFDLNHMGETASFLNPELPEVIFTMGNGGLSYSLSDNAGDFNVSEDLWQTYTDDNDLRRTYFIKHDGSYPAYVKEGDRSDLSRSALSNNFLFRTAEAWLNLAEASAYAGDETTARNALDNLRRHRLENPAEVTESGADLIRFIRDERRRELCLEGHRWFDLRRYMVCEKEPFSKPIRHSYTVFEEMWWISSYEPVQSDYYELKANDDAYTLPIPKEVIEYNTGMPSNKRDARPIVETINY